MPELGGETTLEQCLSEARQAGYVGIESGGKFPKKSSELINIIQNHPQPNKVIIFKNSINEDKDLPYLNFYKSNTKGRPLVYVCQNYSCKLPTDDINVINEMLK